MWLKESNPLSIPRGCVVTRSNPNSSGLGASSISTSQYIVRMYGFTTSYQRRWASISSLRHCVGWVFQIHIYKRSRSQGSDFLKTPRDHSWSGPSHRPVSQKKSNENPPAASPPIVVFFGGLLVHGLSQVRFLPHASS